MKNSIVLILLMFVFQNNLYALGPRYYDPTLMTYEFKGADIFVASVMGFLAARVSTNEKDLKKNEEILMNAIFNQFEDEEILNDEEVTYIICSEVSIFLSKIIEEQEEINSDCISLMLN